MIFDHRQIGRALCHANRSIGRTCSPIDGRIEESQTVGCQPRERIVVQRETHTPLWSCGNASRIQSRSFFNAHNNGTCSPNLPGDDIHAGDRRIGRSQPPGRVEKNHDTRRQAPSQGMARIDNLDLRPCNRDAVGVIRLDTQFVKERGFPVQNRHGRCRMLRPDIPRTHRGRNDDQLLAGGIGRIGKIVVDRSHGKTQGRQPIERRLVRGV